MRRIERESERAKIDFHFTSYSRLVEFAGGEVQPFNCTISKNRHLHLYFQSYNTFSFSK